MAKELNDFENEIRKLLDERLVQGALSGDDCLHILLTLAKAKNNIELNEAAKNISERFPFFKEVFLHEARKELESLHAIVHAFVEKMIEVDPLKAAQFSKMALKKETTLKELFQFVPEFKKFYEENAN